MGRPRRLNVDRTIQSEYGRIGRDIGGFRNRVNNMIPGAQQRSTDLYNQILARAGQASNQSYSPNDFESYGIFRDFAGPNGGIDPNRISSIDENIGGFKDIAKTGGWSEQDQVNARARASRTPTAFFTNLRNDMERRRSATSGYAPGFGAAAARNTRESARAATDAVLDADIGIAESIRSGKLAGLTGANSAEMGLINAISQGRQFGASGMQQGEGMALDATQRENLAGMSALANLYGSSPGELGMLLGLDLEGLGMQGNQTQGLIGQQGAEDTRRWDRKQRVANTGAGAAVTAAGGGPGGTGQFMNKPRG